MMDAGEVDAGNLQIVAVDIALMKCVNAVADYFLVRASAIGITEGFHRKMKLIQRRAYGYRNFQNYRLRVLIECGHIVI